MDSQTAEPKNWYISRIDVSNRYQPQAGRLLGFLRFMGVSKPRKAVKRLKRFCKEKSATCLGVFYKDERFAPKLLGVAVRTSEAKPKVDILLPPACVVPFYDQKEGRQLKKLNAQESRRLLMALITMALSVPNSSKIKTHRMGPLDKARLRLIGEKEVIRNLTPSGHRRIKTRQLFGLSSIGVAYDLEKYQDRQRVMKNKKGAPEHMRGVKLPSEILTGVQPELFLQTR